MQREHRHLENLGLPSGGRERGTGGVAEEGAGEEGGRSRMYSSAPCWSCYLSGEVHPRDGAAAREYGGGCRAELSLPSSASAATGTFPVLLLLFF